MTGSIAHNRKGKAKEDSSTQSKPKEDEDDEDFSNLKEGRLKLKRLEMPLFDGENPNSWVYQAEIYYEMHHLSEREKVKVAVVSFEPDNVGWFKWANKRKWIQWALQRESEGRGMWAPKSPIVVLFKIWNQGNRSPRVEIRYYPRKKNTSIRRGPNARHLTDAEYQARHDKGLCFRCDEKTSIGHR